LTFLELIACLFAALVMVKDGENEQVRADELVINA